MMMGKPIITNVNSEVIPHLITTALSKVFPLDGSVTWWRGPVPVAGLRVAHDDFRRIPLRKGCLWVDEWKEKMAWLDRAVLPVYDFIHGAEISGLPPIIAVRRDDGFHVIDGQARTLATLDHGGPEIAALWWDEREKVR